MHVSEINLYIESTFKKINKEEVETYFKKSKLDLFLNGFRESRRSVPNKLPIKSASWCCIPKPPNQRQKLHLATSSLSVSSNKRQKTNFVY